MAGINSLYLLDDIPISDQEREILLQHGPALESASNEFDSVELMIEIVQVTGLPEKINIIADGVEATESSTEYEARLDLFPDLISTSVRQTTPVGSMIKFHPTEKIKLTPSTVLRNSIKCTYAKMTAYVSILSNLNFVLQFVQFTFVYLNVQYLIYLK